MTNEICGAALLLRWSEAPWDEAVLGAPVYQIEHIGLHGDGALARQEFGAFERRRDANGVGLVSCRLAHDSLRESMLLEDHGFRFIEMVYRPERELSAADSEDCGLLVAPARAADLPALLEIAGQAFRNERFRMDPRLDPAAADQRYRNWVSSAFDHPRQELFVLRDGPHIVAFFVIELMADGVCYWHLNAIAPQQQGRGFGRRCWLAMMGLARRRGCSRVASSVVARNHRVVNLYAKLGFRFPSPFMTFHWVAP